MPRAFVALVPWLVLSATALFMLQPMIVRAIRRGQSSELDDVDAQRSITTDHTATGSLPSAGVMCCQILVGIYGGYFGAGVGIFTLAVLGFMGLTNIHRMNGLKNWGGLCMNAVAAATFAVTLSRDGSTLYAVNAGRTFEDEGSPADCLPMPSTARAPRALVV